MKKIILVSLIIVLMILLFSTTFAQEHEIPNFYYVIYYSNGDLIFLNTDRIIDFDIYEMEIDGEILTTEYPMISLPAQGFLNQLTTLKIRLIDKEGNIIAENKIVDFTFVEANDGLFLDLSEEVYLAKTLVLPRSNLESISGIEKFSQLERLYAVDSEFRYWNGISELKNLEALYCYYCDGYVEPLTSLKNIKELSIDIVWMLTEYPLLKEFENLKLLQMQGMTFADLSTIPELSNLEVLQLRGAIQDTQSLSALSNLENFKVLELWNSEIDDISFVQDYSDIRYIGIPYANISDLTALAGLTSLKGLDLNSNNIENIDSLKNLSNLTKLLLNNNNIKDISPLENLLFLEYLDLGYNEIVDVSQISYFLNLKQLSIIENPIIDYSPLDILQGIYIEK